MKLELFPRHCQYWILANLLIALSEFFRHFPPIEGHYHQCSSFVVAFAFSVCGTNFWRNPSFRCVHKTSWSCIVFSKCWFFFKSCRSSRPSNCRLAATCATFLNHCYRVWCRSWILKFIFAKQFRFNLKCIFLCIELYSRSLVKY